MWLHNQRSEQSEAENETATSPLERRFTSNAVVSECVRISRRLQFVGELKVLPIVADAWTFFDWRRLCMAPLRGNNHGKQASIGVPSAFSFHLAGFRLLLQHANR
jgi:hypothetical protein